MPFSPKRKKLKLKKKRTFHWGYLKSLSIFNPQGRKKIYPFSDVLTVTLPQVIVKSSPCWLAGGSKYAGYIRGKFLLLPAGLVQRVKEPRPSANYRFFVNRLGWFRGSVIYRRFPFPLSWLVWLDWHCVYAAVVLFLFRCLLFLQKVKYSMKFQIVTTEISC